MDIKNHSPRKILLFAIFGLIFSIYMSTRNTNIRSEYKSVSDIEELDGRVDDFFEYTGGTYLILENYSKIYIPQSWNEMLEPNSLCKFLKKGDLLKKEKGSEYIIICRGSIGYIFRIGDTYYSEAPNYEGCELPR